MAKSITLGDTAKKSNSASTLDRATSAKNITNDRLREEFGDKLSDTGCVVFAIEPTKNDSYKHVYVAQLATTADYKNPAGLSAAGNDSRKPLTSFESQMLGGNGGGFIVRAHFNVSNEKIEELGLEVGSTIDGLKIKIIDGNEPWFDDDRPRQRNGNILVDEDDEPIYRTTVVEFADEFDGHDNITVAAEVKPSKIRS